MVGGIYGGQNLNRVNLKVEMVKDRDTGTIKGVDILYNGWCIQIMLQKFFM